MREITYREAVREALREEMKRDESVFLLGEDIGVFGGSYKVTPESVALKLLIMKEEYKTPFSPRILVKITSSAK